MAWLYLAIAGICEVAWAIALKESESFSRLKPSLYFVFAAAGSLAFLLLALRSLPVGTAYAVWTGIGAVGTALAGIVFLDENADLLRLSALALVVVGIAGLYVAEA
jgi:quaternary ammonium compound-resistance protein SugE